MRIRNNHFLGITIIYALLIVNILFLFLKIYINLTLTRIKIN